MTTTELIDAGLLPCQEAFEEWAAKNTALCLDEIIISSDGVPVNPYFEHDTKFAYAIWMEAWNTRQPSGVVEAREKLAKFMLSNGFATGHGDSIDDLLVELEWQIKERAALASLPSVEKIDD